MLDKEALDKQHAVAAVWDKIREQEAKIRYGNRTWWEKAFDAAGLWRVAGVLSHASIIGKLTAAAVTRTGGQVLEDVAIGGALRKFRATRGLMKKASEGGAIEGQVDVRGRTYMASLRA